MVLIRLCHVAELPTPGDLVRRLQANPPASLAAPPPASPPPPPSGGGARAVAGGGIVHAQAAQAPVAQAAAAPRLQSFRDVVALVATARDPLLHGHLLHSAHLVRFAPPVIELRPHTDAPRDMATRLGTLLLEATGTRWTIAFSRDAGEPTIAAQGQAADKTRRATAAEHPLVRAILEAFPGATIDAVRDPGVDSYGLPTDIPLGEPETDELEFAPLDPEAADADLT